MRKEILPTRWRPKYEILFICLAVIATPLTAATVGVGLVMAGDKYIAYQAEVEPSAPSIDVEPGAEFLDSASSTRSAGANDLTNIGAWFSASGGQVNYAAVFEGNVVIKGNVIVVHE